MDYREQLLQVGCFFRDSRRNAQRLKLRRKRRVQVIARRLRFLRRLSARRAKILSILLALVFQSGCVQPVREVWSRPRYVCLINDLASDIICCLRCYSLFFPGQVSGGMT